LLGFRCPKAALASFRDRVGASVKLQNRTVIVTGAASGMGRALCYCLSREGARLGLVDRNEKGVRAVADDLSSQGVSCLWAVADVRRRKEIDVAINTLAVQLGPVDVLVASAGVLELWPADELMVDQVEETMQVNFLGVVYAINAVLPAMLMRGSGHIVGMASLVASRGIPYEAAYGASKAALGNYLESLRPGLRQRGIAVTTVYPGFVSTPLLEGATARLECRSPLLRALQAINLLGFLSGVVTPEAAARKITRAIIRRRRVLSFPLSTRIFTRLGYLLPAAIYDWFIARFTARVALVAPAAPPLAAITGGDRAPLLGSAGQERAPVASRKFRANGVPLK
jgi:short-subunit dehydrogenase